MVTPRKAARHRSTTQDAVHDIKEYIRENRLSTGDMLPSEAVLCEELGCSRSAVREAIRTLATLDIVEVRHGYGTFVASMSLEPLVQSLVFRTLLDEESVAENMSNVIDAREAVELALSAELAGSCTESDLRILREQVAKIRERIDQKEPWFLEDQMFHHALTSKAKNPLIRELHDAFGRVHFESQKLLEIGVIVNSEQLIHRYLGIMEALESQNLDVYQTAITEYYECLRQFLRAELSSRAPKTEQK